MGRRAIPKNSFKSYVKGGFLWLEDPDEITEEIGASVSMSVDNLLTNFDKNKVTIAKYYNQLLYPYIPFETGKLANPIITRDGTIHYTAKSKKGYDYALRQYTDESLEHPNRDGQHPAATAYWDFYAHDEIWPEFMKGVRQILGTRKVKGKW